MINADRYKPLTMDAARDTRLLSDEPEEIQQEVLEWIRTGFTPRKTFLEERTDYGLKHILQRDTGIYLTSNQFKDAMLIAGFEPKDRGAFRWVFGISKKSPALQDRVIEGYCKKRPIRRRRIKGEWKDLWKRE